MNKVDNLSISDSKTGKLIIDLHNPVPYEARVEHKTFSQVLVEQTETENEVKITIAMPSNWTEVKRLWNLLNKHALKYRSLKYPLDVSLKSGDMSVIFRGYIVNIGTRRYTTEAVFKGEKWTQ